MNKYDDFLTQYLETQQEISLNKIGQLFIKARAFYNESTHEIQEGAVNFAIDKKATTSQGLIEYIATLTGKNSSLISSDVESYLEQGRQFLNIGDTFSITGIGSFSKNNSGNYLFNPGPPVLLKIKKKKEITEAVFAAQEKERSGIGRELHDNMNQILGAVRLYIGMARKDEKSRDSLLTTASTFILTAIEEIRKLSRSLITPLEEKGLADAINDLAAEIMQVHPIHISLTAKDLIEDGLTGKFKINIFRIIQEQINNTLKHAKAKNIWIDIDGCDSSRLLFSISDDGIGFDTTMKRNGVGITNIKSRAELYNGSVLLSSVLGKGTTLVITFNKKDLLLGSNELCAS